MIRTVAVLIAIGATMSGTAAEAVGDVPRTLTARQAAVRYAGVRALLASDGRTCPAGQRPTSGLLTGGGTPGTRSETATLRFDGGATVTIARNWADEGPGQPAMTVTVTCKQRP